jgi:type IV pilus assembly protein PilV
MILEGFGTVLDTQRKSHRKVHGLSLIEVLITLLILSVGLLGMAGLQAMSLKNNNSAYHRTQANALAYDIVDSMRSNRDLALNGAYNMSVDPAILASAPCAPSGSGNPKNDLAIWCANLWLLLPSGTGGVTCTNATSICEVIVAWDDDRRGTPVSVRLSTRL